MISKENLKRFNRQNSSLDLFRLVCSVVFIKHKGKNA